MARFLLKDTNTFYLPGNDHMVHWATISSGLREFVYMSDIRTQKEYIEEVVLTSVDFQKDIWANFKFIEEDSLAEDLAAFCEEHGLRDIKRRTEKLIDQGKFFPSSKQKAR